MFRYLFLYILLSSSSVYAQETEYLFQRLGVKDGLFEETVHAVQQDAKGFIWINYRTLIQRYDGHRFMNFFPGNRLPEGNIRAMCIDKKNRLWLLSGNSTLGYLNPDDFNYHPVKVNVPKGYDPVVTAFYVNRQQQVMLIWDKQGFITYSDETDEIDAIHNPFQLPKGYEPIHMWQDEENNYWVGTVNGLVKYNPTKKVISYAGNNRENDVAVNAFQNSKSINSVYKDRQQNCWIISWELGLKIHSVNLVTGKKTEWQNKIGTAVENRYYVPYGFSETGNSELWIYGVNLFCKIDVKAETVRKIPNNSPDDFRIRYDNVFSIFQDREQNIWAGTNKGLFRFNPAGQLFSIFTNKRNSGASAKTTEADVTGFLETASGHLFVSTWGSGIFSYNHLFKPELPSEYSSINRLGNAMVWDMEQRSNGDIWCGMQGGAIFILEAATNKLIQKTVPQADGRTIRQLVVDPTGNIWMGTQYGALICWNAALNTFTKYHQFNGLISRLYIDQQNRLWAGTDRDGLYCVNMKTGALIHHYTSTGKKGKTLLINGVADLMQYNDSTFYIAGNGLSILNINTQRFKYFTVSDGLPSANISNLIKDGDGYIWMSSGSGILSYHPVKSKLSQFDASDGVANFNFNTGAARLLKNGAVVFGTNRDVLHFEPDKLTIIKYAAPKVHISGIELMNKPAPVDSLLQLPRIELSHQQNTFKVLFTSLKYKDVHPVYYMLEGIDETWKKAGRMNVVEYNYLPPGDYVLKATCFNEDGTPGEVTSVKIYINAPFYRKWWFYSLLALLVTGLLLWLDRERMKRKEAIYKMRSNIAGKLHEDINVALNNINILSEIAKLKADTEPAKSKEFIEQIHSKSHNMIIAMDDMLWSIAPENDSMQQTIERMREFIDMQMNRHGMHIELLIDEKVKQLKLPMQLRHEAFLLFKESLNGLLQAKSDNLRIQLGQDKACLLIMIEFNNEYCDMQQLNHFLHNRELGVRLDAIQAKIDIHVHKSYAVVECRIPLQYT